MTSILAATSEAGRTLTDFEIAETAYAVGFGYPSGVVTAVAVALAESRGRTHVINTAGNHPPSRDRGLWQINDYYHPEVTDAMAFDPILCATAALRISNGGRDWHPWSTYVSGSYLQFTTRATAAARVCAPGGFTLHRYLRSTTPATYGIDVASLQHVLHIPVTGVYDPPTLAAVQGYQKMHHLIPDGIVGPKTAAAVGWSWVLIR